MKMSCDDRPSDVGGGVQEVPEMQRADTANSLVYEANARLRDPVYGCMGLVSTLQQQAQALQAELNAMKGEVMCYRAAAATAATAAVTICNSTDVQVAGVRVLQGQAGPIPLVSTTLATPTTPPQQQPGLEHLHHSAALSRNRASSPTIPRPPHLPPPFTTPGTASFFGPSVLLGLPGPLARRVSVYIFKAPFTQSFSAISIQDDISFTFFLIIATQYSQTPKQSPSIVQ
ncbi:hypothetical protein L7F22_011165 [Adiantum nelumboides]|nr:hypothetical protein [Adiantum nelumboides]